MKVCKCSLLSPMAVLINFALIGSVATAQEDRQSTTDMEEAKAEAEARRRKNQEQMRFQNEVKKAAFEPRLYFTEELLGGEIYIQYGGDDYGYPVWSMAIMQGCERVPLWKDDNCRAKSLKLPACIKLNAPVGPVWHF